MNNDHNDNTYSEGHEDNCYFNDATVAWLLNSNSYRRCNNVLPESLYFLLKTKCVSLQMVTQASMYFIAV